MSKNKCTHIYTDGESGLDILQSRTTFIDPKEYYVYCNICGESFKTTKIPKELELKLKRDKI